MLKQCNKCVMDNIENNIYFDDKGICNYCNDSKIKFKMYDYNNLEIEKNLAKLSKEIKKRKKRNSKYDSILGLSGGVDSSYVAYLAMKMKLNPLCVHFDNGWNSDIAIKNIKNIINVSGYDLYTYVIDWPEFRDIQRSFFKAGVIDIEMITDHAIFASLFKLKKRFKIDTVLSGTNFRTEHGMPNNWVWMKMDLKNLKSIQKKFGTKKIKSFPTMSPFFWFLMRKFHLGGHFEEPLNKVNYEKIKAMEILKDKFLWQDYGGKHYESIFTKFYQAYVLPVKFNVDKRKVHLSCLIRNNEITKEQALVELQTPLYNPANLKSDREFVLKKLGFEEIEFFKLMNQDAVSHDSYPSYKNYKPFVSKLAKFLGLHKIN